MVVANLVRWYYGMNLATNNVQNICQLLIQYNYNVYEVNIDHICRGLGVIIVSDYISTNNFIVSSLQSCN